MPVYSDKGKFGRATYEALEIAQKYHKSCFIVPFNKSYRLTLKLPGRKKYYEITFDGRMFEWDFTKKKR